MHLQLDQVEFYPSSLSGVACYCPICDRTFSIYSGHGFYSHMLQEHQYRPKKSLIIKFLLELASIVYQHQTNDLSSPENRFREMLTTRGISIDDLELLSSSYLKTHRIDDRRVGDALESISSPDVDLFYKLMCIIGENNESRSNQERKRKAGRQRDEARKQRQIAKEQAKEQAKRAKRAKEETKVLEIVNRKLRMGISPDEVTPLTHSRLSAREAASVLSELDRVRKRSDQEIRGHIDRSPEPETLGKFGMPKDKSYRGSNPKNTLLTSTRRKK